MNKKGSATAAYWCWEVCVCVVCGTVAVVVAVAVKKWMTRCAPCDEQQYPYKEIINENSILCFERCSPSEHHSLSLSVVLYLAPCTFYLPGTILATNGVPIIVKRPLAGPVTAVMAHAAAMSPAPSGSILVSTPQEVSNSCAFKPFLTPT